jgi:hypothetical protein
MTTLPKGMFYLLAAALRDMRRDRRDSARMRLRHAIELLDACEDEPEMVRLLRHEDLL